MKSLTVLFVFLLAQSASQFASADVVDTKWWSNQTSSNSVVESVGPEELRLAGSQTSGFLEGVVNLPFESQWRIDFDLRSDETNEIPGEYVDAFVNGVFVERTFNAPVNSDFNFSHQIFGTSFDYRFEFASDTSSGLNTHMVVGKGLVTSVPEPNSLVLIVMLAGGGLLVRRRRRWTKGVKFDSLDTARHLGSSDQDFVNAGG